MPPFLSAKSGMVRDRWGEPRLSSWDIMAGSLPFPLIIAHRGDGANAPENTIKAFRSAYELGADGIELDVRLTADDQLVGLEAPPASNGKGLVNHATLEEMRALDVGSWFGPQFRGETAPTLDEVFESLPPGFLINVEMKAARGCA